MKTKKIGRRGRIWMAVICLLLLLMAAVYTVCLKPDGNEETYIYKETTVEYGDLVQGIMESGTVELLTGTQDYDVVIDEDEEDDDDDDDDEDTRYLKVEEVYVQQGQRIREGDPLLKVTERSVRSVRRYLRSSQADAQIALEELQNEYEINQLSAKHDYISSVTEASLAQLKYDTDNAQIAFELQQIADSIAVLRNEIEQTEKDLADTWDDYADLKEEYEKYQRRYYEWDKDNLYEYVPLRTQYLDAKQKYEDETENRQDKREEMADKQQEILDKIEEYQRLAGQTERSQMTSRQELESSTLAGEMAEDVYTYSLKSLEEDIAQAQKELADLDDVMADFDAFVGEDGIVYAESDGLVTNVAYEAGDILREDSALITYVKEDDYVITIDVAQEDMPYVKVGDTVTIEFGAYPDEIYEGVIREITTTQVSENTATVSYPVTVEIKGDTKELYGGMTGDVTFVTDEADQVNYVSKKAIVKDQGKTYVYVKNDKDEMVLQEVTTGFTDGVNIQIISGLDRGDTVYIASRVSANQSEEELKNESSQTKQVEAESRRP
ncbi:MAG: HlyD family efflux transporter periplasmic adaptor subunit [Lachnospiraceae bacterium]|nr:HlyD family efflux transporter periplasmic adaptor subunit [Lachnospiraceae bacterium]MDY4068577.1 HlyD family efflux transporter periplasmic adaptor subunit [Lachnospiraceae bacterium]